MGLDYTDISMISQGKHKHTRLLNIPAEYLLKIHAAGIERCFDKSLYEYIDKNLERIKRRNETGVSDAPEEEHCDKFAYATKKIANEALRKIRDAPGNHKKPIRSYECEKCSQWHLTSWPVEEWKYRKDKIRT